MSDWLIELFPSLREGDKWGGPAGVLVKALVRRRRFFQQHIKLFRGEVVIKEIDRVDFLAVLVYFVMTMGAG